MAAREEDLRLTTNLKSFKDVSKLGKVKLKQICKNLGVDIEKSFENKKLLSMLFAIRWVSQHQALHQGGTRNRILLARCRISLLRRYLRFKELQKLNDWKKSLLSIPQLMDEAIVKEFLLGVGYSQTDVRKYKTLRAWQHKQGIHSVK